MTRENALERRLERDWGAIDAQHVASGRRLMDRAWVRHWHDELEAMNSGKRGRPYRFPRSLVRFASRLGLRRLQGALASLLGSFGLEAPDYTTLRKRLLLDEDELTVPRSKEHVLAIDSTGLAVSRRSEWLRGRNRGFVKLHAAVDVASGAFASYVVTDERTGDSRLLPTLVRQAQESLDGRVVKVLADATYDARANFDFLDLQGIEAGINVRRRANAKVQGGSMARSRVVREIKRVGVEVWKCEHGYSDRWTIERTFGGFKRMFDDAISSRSLDTMRSEIERNVIAYNAMLLN